jgi:uncharacterized protein YjbJ (UPF0337 family)
MNSDQIAGKWSQIKGDILQKWGKLTDDDREVIEGRKHKFLGWIQERYGIAKEAAQQQLYDMLKKDAPAEPRSRRKSALFVEEQAEVRAYSEICLSRKRRFEMADKNTAVIGIYPTHASLENGVQALKDAGFRHPDISVLYPEDLGDKGSAHKKGEAAPEGATTGASAGAVVGGVLGWLAGIGSLVVPGMGPFIAAGPIVGALAGAGAAGIVGGVAGSLAGLGVPEDQATGYQEQLKDGGTLLAVYSDNWYWTKCAIEILVSTGAQGIVSTGGTGPNFEESEHPPRRSE